MHADHDARVALVAPVVHHHVARGVANGHHHIGADDQGWESCQLHIRKQHAIAVGIAPVAGA